MNPIKQYLKEREEEFDVYLGLENWGGRSANGETLIKPTDVKSFHSETIKGLIERLVKEEILKKESIHYTLQEAEIRGYNTGKQESRDRLLELIK